MLKITKEIKKLVKELEKLGFDMEDFQFQKLSELKLYLNGFLKDVKKHYQDNDKEKEESDIDRINDIVNKIKKEADDAYSTKTLKEYVNIHSYLFENRVYDTLKDLVEKTKKEMDDSETEAEKVEVCKENWDKIKSLISKLINNVVRDSFYPNITLVPAIKQIMKNAGDEDSEIKEYLEVSGDPEADKKNAKTGISKKEKYESKMQIAIADITKVGKKIADIEDVSGEEEDEVEGKDKERAERIARENAARVTVDDIEAPEEAPRGRRGRVKEKVVLGIIKREKGKVIESAIIGNTDLTEKQITELEYEDEVLDAIIEPRTLKTSEEIDKHLIKLEADKVYYYSAERKNEDKEYWIIKKVK